MALLPVRWDSRFHDDARLRRRRFLGYDDLSVMAGQAVILLPRCYGDMRAASAADITQDKPPRPC